jgi:hypothetical protein
MDDLSPTLQMLTTLGATRAMVANSTHEGWSGESPDECTQVLDSMMAFLIDPDRNECPKLASIQFLPTGPLQEIAMANGWDEGYLALAERFDQLEAELSTFSRRGGWMDPQCQSEALREGSNACKQPSKEPTASSSAWIRLLGWLGF